MDFILIYHRLYIDRQRAARAAARGVELQAEQILTGSRADIHEKVGAESRADTKLLQFFAFFAVFMPFLYRYWNKRAVIVDQTAEQTSLIYIIEFKLNKKKQIILININYISSSLSNSIRFFIFLLNIKFSTIFFSFHQRYRK